MKNKKIKVFIIVIFTFICFTVFCYSGFMVIKWFFDNNKNRGIKDDINKNISIEEDKVSIDFDELKKKNSDTIAYLKVNGTNIDYVVLKGNNNDYYLNHNFDKEYNVSGWVFADFRNKFDGTDKNIIIYGHNTMDGSMFGTLKNILTKEWQENTDNQNVVLVTEKGEEVYKVFSVYQTKADDYYINTSFNDNEFSEFIDKLRSMTVYDFNVDVSQGDRILTLSTCSASGRERVVLHAINIK